MPAPSVQCPKCFTRVPVSAEQVGETVVCPGCEREFVAPAPAEPRRRDPSVPLAKAIPVGPSPAPADKSDVPMARPARRSDRDEPAPERRTRSRRRRDDDEDDAPAKKGSALPFILIGGGVLLLLAVLGGAAVVISILNDNARQAKAKQEQAEAEQRARTDEARKRDEELRRSGVIPGPNGGPPPWGGDFPPGGGGPIGPGGGPPGVEPFDPKARPPRPGPVFADVVPQPITPTKLADDRGEVKLPDPVADTCSGGGGRFLICHLGGKKQLAIFDVCEAKVVKYLPLASDTVRFAAGMNKLIVAYPGENTLVRYDLGTFEKEDSQQYPGGTVKRVALGSASAGPLVVAEGPKGGGESKLAFLDPATLKAVDIELENNRFWRDWGENDHLRASPDGSVFATHGTGGLMSVVVRGGSATQYTANDAFGHLTPGPDANLYSGNGLYTGELKRLGRAPAGGNGQQLVPAAEGHLCLHVHPEVHLGDGTAAKVKAEVRMSGEERSVHTFADIGPFSADRWAANPLPLDRRIHFAPAAKLLVTVPHGNDKLVLRKFDLEAAFEANGVDYLYVSSRPPTAVPGKGYEYQIDTRSKKGGVKYKLEAGPDGLAVSDAGKITWATPADFAAAEPVIVTVSDASGQEVFHTFELTAGDGKRFAGPISGAGKVRGPAEGNAGPLVTAPDRVFELKPPPLQQRAEVKLPGAADATAVGGGGRFLLYRIPKAKQLAVLDVVAGKVVKYLPLAEGDALVAAGMTKLFVYYRSAGVLLRYSLETFEKEVTARNPVGGTPSLLLMGHSSDGPLFVGGPGVNDGKGYGFVSARTMKPLDVPLEGDGKGQPPAGPAVGGDRDRDRGERASVAVSPDGRTLSWADGWGGTRVMVLGEKTAKVRGNSTDSEHRGMLVPGPDGTMFGATGLFSPDLKKLGDPKKPVFGTFAPAAGGPWYVGFSEADSVNPARLKRRVFVGLTADDQVRFPLDSLDGLPTERQEPWAAPPAGKVPLAARLHLVPDAEVLAVLDDGMEKVHLHRLPLKPLLDATDREHLLVVSRPPPAARGRNWAYTPEVWSKKGGVKVKVESGPDGLKADGGGVSWEVPEKFADDEAQVLLTVSDAGGQETFHLFAVRVRAALDPAATVLRPKVAAVVPNPGGGKKPVEPAAFPLKPTAAKDGTDVDLPAAADAACLAGGGRFLLLRIPSKKEVAVFDVVDAKVAGTLTLAEEGALVAGGRSFAVVVNPKAGVVQRWNLKTFEKDATTKLPDGFAPQAAVMGHASDAPLLLGATNNHSGQNGLYDPLTVTKLELKAADPARPPVVPQTYRPETVAASPDGRVFAWSDENWGSGLHSLVLDGTTARPYTSGAFAGGVTVGADGTLFTRTGVFAADHAAVYDAHAKGAKAGPRGIELPPTPSGSTPSGHPHVPASDGPFYLWFPPLMVDGKVNDAPPALKVVGVAEPLADMTLRGVSEPRPAKGPGVPPRPVRVRQPVPGESLFPHRRIFLIPAAELLAVLSPDGTKLHLHTFKPRELLDKSGKDYLLLMGGPARYAPPGKRWTYTPDVWSKKGGVKVTVASGPPGLKADGAGVAWDVPADLLDTQVAVELTVSDASGKSVSQAFNLSLDETAPPAGGVKTSYEAAEKGVGKRNGNALVTKHREKIELTASSDWGGQWVVGNLIDGEGTTSWYSKDPDSVGTKNPVVTLKFPSDVAVKRVTVLGTRDPSYASGYTVLEGTVELLDANGKVLSSHPMKGAGEKSDFDLTLDKPTTARSVRFTASKAEGGSCALGEIQVE